MSTRPNHRPRARSKSNILSRATSLAVNDALRLAPLPRDLEVLPDPSATALDEIAAIRVGVDSASHRKLAQDPAAVTINEPKQRSLNLEQPCSRPNLNGQVKEKMAVDDVGVGFALSTPYASQSIYDSPPK